MNRTNRLHAQRGIALLMVLITMAAATTLVMGWLAVQDTSPLVGRNAVRAAQARATAHAGLELAVAILETDAPWRTAHQDGWLFQDHALASGVVNVRLWDAMSNPQSPPDDGTTSVLVESTATVNGLTQVTSAQATVHPFDGSTPGMLDGLALYADNSMYLAGSTRIRNWRGGSGRRLLGIGTDEAGSIVLQGASARQGTAGADLLLPESARSNIIRGSGRGGLARSRRQRPMPDVWGTFGLIRSALPALPQGNEHGEELVIDTPGATHFTQVAGSTTIEGLYLSQDVTLILPAGAQLHVLGDCVLESGATIRVEDGEETTLVIGGNLHATHATIGNVEAARRRRNRPRTADAGALRLVAAGDTDAHWVLRNETLIAARVDAPGATIEADRLVMIGRLAADALHLTDTRLWYDAGPSIGAGLAALAETANRLDLLDRRDTGLDDIARMALLDRIAVLVHPDNVHGGRPVAPPSGDLWLQRPVMVQAQMSQFGGDTSAWEEAALAGAGDSSP